MLRIVIADDELAARRRLKRLLASEPDCALVGEYTNGEAAIAGIRETAPDVALLDIQMPERDGLDVAASLAGAGAGGPAIVFVTAFDQYALRAFDVHAVDYLVKPVEAVRLRSTLARIRARQAGGHADADAVGTLARMIDDLRRAQQTSPEHEKRPRDRLLVAVDGRSILVPTADLDWIEAAGNYVRLHRKAGPVMLRESLASVEASLDPHAFARVHRGAIVNISRIREIQPWFSGAAILILITGQRLTLSRSHRKQFEARFGISADD